MKRYGINDCFLSLQGEGARSGSVNVFLRFAGCNQTCKVESHGFDCDTEFASKRLLDIAEVLATLDRVDSSKCKAVILTGGEPGLQADEEFVQALQAAGWFVAIESNGSVQLSDRFDWITVSPKVAEHALRQLEADEVKYVRGPEQSISRTSVGQRIGKDFHRFISPSFHGLDLDQSSLRNCVRLCLENPDWRLSVQSHKAWGVS